MTLRRSTSLLAICATIGAGIAPPGGTVRADHGPGTSGGGITTQTAETLPPGRFSLEFRLDYTEFDNVSDDQLSHRATNAGSFDSLDRSFLTSMEVGVGVFEDFQLSLSTGYYDAVGAKEAESDPATGQVEISSFGPDGLTDTWLNAKWRFYRGPAGQFAVLGGVKFPTGRDNVRTGEGERVEPSATAGSGAFDAALGLAFTRWLTERIALDASTQYTLRTEHDDFRIGDRIDGGVAAAYRLVDDIRAYPQPLVFTEANVRYLFKSEDDGDRDPNTGGTAVFVSVGLKLNLNPKLALTLAPQFPVYQDLNGEQLKTDFKLLSALTLSF